MGGRLKADLTRIAQVSRQVGQIAREFRQATTLVAGYEPALGSPELAGTLHAFATDWSIHRERLLADLGKESSLAATAVRSYHGTDEQLAAALRTQETADG
ncbi:MAG TPA: hypothetical protein VKV33_11125 [Streptosporangiaceae bacterium]|nr:hypothetical protein [Streptosporangiaceae bacterium]